MIVYLKKRHLFLLAALWCCMAAVFGLSGGKGSQVRSVFAYSQGETPVVIIDAGHGGEDGGAVAEDGTVESQLNLAIALRLEELLRFAGVQTEMTRREDVSIYSAGAETLRQKKVSDLKNRVELVNSAGNALLLSIHQNSLPSSPVTRGAQVFWNTIPNAETLGKTVQDHLNLAVNPGNEKTGKQISDSIYLMKQITAPGVIVECGFLSNREETVRLGEAAYQQQLALSIAAGTLTYLSGDEEP